MVRLTTGSTKINVYVPDNVLAALKKLAEMKGTTYSELIRVASQRYVVQEGPKMIQEARQIAATAEDPSP
jgi:metal-responsive CopG/Arc/MetJ family transcriptional regulator